MLHFFYSLLPPPPTSTLFPYTTLFRSLKRQPYRAPATPLVASLVAAERRAITGTEPTPSAAAASNQTPADRSEEHTSELQSSDHLVCRLLLEKKKKKKKEES